MDQAGTRTSKSRAPLSCLLSVIVASLLLSPACSSPAVKARAELARRGLEFSEGAFLDQVKAGEVEAVRLFLAAGMSPDTEDQGYTALLEATRRGHEKTALELIEAGARVDAKDPYGVSALMFSFIAGSGDAALKLMEKGAAVNDRDIDGRTALIEALTTENDIPTGVIRILIGKGAGVNVRIAGGITPLMIAVSYDPEIVRILLEAGADVNAKDEIGASVLHMAKDNPENAKILKDAGALER